MTRVSELQNFEVTDCLNSQQAITAYLLAALEDEDPDFIFVALSDVARTKGMADVEGEPSFDAIQKICKEYGLKLVAQAAT